MIQTSATSLNDNLNCLRGSQLHKHWRWRRLQCDMAMSQRTQPDDPPSTHYVLGSILKWVRTYFQVSTLKGERRMLTSHGCMPSDQRDTSHGCTHHCRSIDSSQPSFCSSCSDLFKIELALTRHHSHVALASLSSWPYVENTGAPITSS